MPDWVSFSVGLAAILASITFLVIIIVAAYTVVLLITVRSQVQTISAKVDGIANDAKAITAKADDMTTDIAARAKGIASFVDDSASNVFHVIDKYAPLFVSAGILMRLFAFLKRR